MTSLHRVVNIRPSFPAHSCIEITTYRSSQNTASLREVLNKWLNLSGSQILGLSHGGWGAEQVVELERVTDSGSVTKVS